MSCFWRCSPQCPPTLRLWRRNESKSRRSSAISSVERSCTLTIRPPLWTPGLHIADHTTYGMRVGFNATPNLEPEIQWSHTDTELSPPERRRKGPTQNRFLHRGRQLQLRRSLLPTLRWRGTRRGTLRRAQLQQAHSLHDELRARHEVFFTPNFGLRLEGRGYASKPDSIIKTTCPQCNNDWILNGDLTGGVTVAF
jgi:hypothetical protein